MHGMRPEAIQRQADEALRILHLVKDAVANGAAADREISTHFRANRQFGSRDRRFFGALVFSYFRWKGWVDAIPNFPRALAAACWLSNESHHPALALWAEMPPEPAPTASLTERAAALATWQGWAHAPDHRALFPDWFFEEVIRGEDPADEIRIAASFQQRPPLWLRARSGHQRDVVRLLAKAGFTATPDARVPTAFRVDGTPSAEVLRPILHQHAEVQDIASQVVGQLCAPTPGQQWWDVCAGAGGKTLHLLDALDKKGFVFCSDIRAAALRELTRRAHDAHYSSFATRALPEDPAEWRVEEQFDGILLDAPCSGIGTWGRAPDARWRITRDELRSHRDRQLALLQHAAQQLKPGGRLVYAVCSLSKSETGNVIEAFLNQSPSFTRDPAGCRTIYPDFGPGIGMWIATLHKA